MKGGEHQIMRDDYYQKRSGDTFFAFMTGLVLGGIAALLTSRDNREKVVRTFEDVKQQGQDFQVKTAQKAEEVANEIGKNVKEMSENAQAAIHSEERKRTNK
jgi:gas vesicle protein